MVAVYGLVLTVAFAIVCVVGTVGVHINRHHPFIKYRHPTLLTLQNCGTLLTTTIISLYIALRPNFNCHLYTLATFLAYSNIGFPVTIRVWVYVVNFYLSQVRSKLKPDELMDDLGDHSIFFRHRWVIKYKVWFLVFCFTFWIWLLPLVPQFLYENNNEYSETTGNCKVYQPTLFISALILLSYVFFGFFCAKLIWGIKDAYKIKTELTLISITWLLFICIWLPWTTLDLTTKAHVPGAFWILLGLYVTFFFSSLFPLYFVYRGERVDKVLSEAGYSDFVEMLENPPVRTEFHDFLMRQLCQENILFYEVVMNWKRMDVHNPKRAAHAIQICETYIMESGACTINIDFHERERVMLQVHNKDEQIPQDIFDAPLKTVLGMMHANSYYQFKTNRLNTSGSASV